MEDVVGALGNGRYELYELVGAGAAGSVRRGHDTLLDREVAVKMLRGSGDETVRARMRAEAQLAGGLHHPGIAQVYDYGEEGAEDDPAPYIVMQLVEGTSLWQLLKERRVLPPAEVMDVVAQVAGALQAAHEAGIVHRDLKPANMLVTPEGRVVLVDFGIARTADAEPLTMTGTIVGTADYISPEQSRGEPATGRSDLYSLGMVAYECLTGRKPFRRETDVATALAHLREEAPPLGPEVPVGVRALVEELIAKDPRARPARAADVAARAAALASPEQAGPPAAARARPRLRPIRGRVLRSRRVYVAGAVLLAMVAGSFLVAARDPAPRDTAVRVPDLRGDRVATAERLLDDRGLDARRRVTDDPDAARGTVLDQEPPAGARAEGGDVVTLSVASGRTDLSPQDVVGKPYDEAARALVRLGLVPAKAMRTRPAGAGAVVGVQPTGRLPLGTEVTLVVAMAPR